MDHLKCDEIHASKDVNVERVLLQRRLAKEIDNNFDRLFIPESMPEESPAIISKSNKRKSMINKRKSNKFSSPATKRMTVIRPTQEATPLL
jgi:hypothetical protein